MSQNRYEIEQGEDGTFAVHISDGIVADATVMNFASLNEAEEFIAEERRKLGIDGRWRPGLNITMWEWRLDSYLTLGCFLTGY